LPFSTGFGHGIFRQLIIACSKKVYNRLRQRGILTAVTAVLVVLVATVLAEAVALAVVAVVLAEAVALAVAVVVALAAVAASATDAP